MNESTHREFKDRIYEQFARVGKALASPRRLEMLDLLAQGERSVEDIAAETGTSVANASHHLQKLKGARLVTDRREGNYVLYSLADPEVFDLWRSIRTVGERQLGEIQQVVDQFLTDREALEAVTVEELEERLGRSDLLLLDVRPEEEYRSAHVAGARSVPVDAVERYFDQLPRDQEVIAYCRGPYCVFSDEVVSKLRDQGFQARRLETGLPDLRARGFPIASEESDSS